jgi:outer membrane immunogenic protein
MRRIFLASATASLLAIAPVTTNAADLPARTLSPPVPTWTWTGFYIGGNLGGAWADRNTSDSRFGLSFSNRNSNNGVFIGGGQLGYNAQFGALVVGAEWDFDWSGSNNNAGNGVFAPAIGASFRVASSSRWMSTVAARFGAAIDRVLIYGKAGAGWVGNDGFVITNLTTGTSITGPDGGATSGWLVGAGVEWAVAPSWTVKVEYNYLTLSNRSFVMPAAAPFLAGDTFTRNNFDVQTVKAGFNYLFNWGGPVVARY